MSGFEEVQGLSRKDVRVKFYRLVPSLECNACQAMDVVRRGTMRRGIYTSGARCVDGSQQAGRERRDMLGGAAESHRDMIKSPVYFGLTNSLNTQIY